MMRFLTSVPKGMLVAVVMALAILIGLGTWQMSRLQWKERLTAEMARTEAMPPIPVSDLLRQDKPDWRSAVLPSCTIRPDRLIHMHSAIGGVAGYRVLTACPAGDRDMLVDLGFTEAELTLPGPVTREPVGRIRPLDKPSAIAPVNRPEANDWYTRSATDMGKALQAQVREDYFLVLDVNASALDIPGLRQAPATAPLTNRHLEYALTWYGLAMALIGIFIAYVVQRRRAQVRT